MKNSFYIDLQRFMLIPTKFPLTPSNPQKTRVLNLGVSGALREQLNSLNIP